jgi:hypothetical protein
MTKHNFKGAVDLARTLRGSIRNFLLQLHRVEADLPNTQAAIEKQVRHIAAIREIEISMKFSLTQLQELLDITSTGNLSSVLISPYNLSTILQQVSL